MNRVETGAAVIEGTDRVKGGMEMSLTRKADRAAVIVSICFEKMAMFSLFVLMLVVAIDVIGRFLFNAPVKGALELIELLMVPLVFLGMGTCTRQGRHVAVDLLTSRFSGRARGICNAVTSAASAIVFGAIAWQTGAQGFEEMFSRDSTVSMVLRLPEYPFIIVAAVGCLSMCAEFVSLALGGARSELESGQAETLGE